METNKDNQNKKRLGRGIGSLLGGAEANAFNNQPVEQIENNKPAKTSAPPPTAEIPNEQRIWHIAIDKLVPGVYQPRKNFEKESLEELATSIKENGIIQPIAVRKRNGGGFEIIAGERRWRAAQMAGLHEVPAIIKTITDREALQIALIENVQREDLDPIEEADSYQRLMEEFSLSQQDVADKVGKERSTVANAIRLLSLPNELKEMLAAKKISVGHAKALLSLTDKTKQIALAKKAFEKGLSVRAIEAEIKAQAFDVNENQAKAKQVGINIDIASKLAKELADQLQKALGTKVEISYKSGKGKVEINFYSDEQLTQIYEKLKS
ncbi:MAG: ParB/RepB/Spo0J family partition protein [Bdellovibrionaceae bacterium]|nr:ParB/RepB/Spo0J family partition protein [Bdellovibrio sp.]